MKSKTSESFRSKSVKKSKSATKQYTEETTVERQVLQRTPPQNKKKYLTDEIWDILPKTDYTYASSGSYSPRFFGRKYTWPNMSRYRIRVNGRGQENDEEEFSDKGEGLMDEDSYDDEYDGEDDFDRSSDVSYETVLEDGMSLRSGKNLHTLTEYISEHDREAEIPTTSAQRRSTRDDRFINTEITTYDVYSTSKKFQKSQLNARQLSMSEQKGRGKNSAQNQIGPHSVNEKTKQNSDLYRRRTISSYTNGYDSSSYSSDSVYNDNRYVNNSSVRKTLEFDEIKEKAASEIPEKLMKSKVNETSQHVKHMYGLEPVESDTELSDSGSGYTSTDYNYNGISRRGRGRGHRDGSMTTTTTTVTTITETFKRFSNPVIEQSWNYVGRPLWSYVGYPVWNYILHPLLSVISTVVLSTWEFLFGEAGVVKSVVETVFVGVEKSSVAGPFSYISSAFMWILRKVESFVMQFVLLDVWLLSRRRNRGCCFCLPLILLLPFLIALASNRELWIGNIFGGNSSLSSLSFSYFTRPVPNIPADVPFDKQEFFSQLNAEVKVWLLEHQQLQSANQLTEAHVEAIVFRILQKELATLRDEMAQAAVIGEKKQGEWRRDHEDRIEHINKQYNSLLVSIENLQASVAQQREDVANKAGSDFSQHSLNLATLEDQLSVQRVKLDGLEKEFGAVLLKIKDCCHNETYYAALVKAGVDAALKERMAGYATGTAKDAFSEWLRLNFVNQDNADDKLKVLESDLRRDVLAMIKAIEEKQQQYYQELQQVQEGQQVNPHYTVNTGTGLGLDEQKVKLLIEAALLRYSADRIGIPDYALESAGGAVLSTRCSETYYRKSALLSVFGIPLWYSSNSPRTVIQPEVLPGQCWAFSGAEGYIVIQTSTRITPSGFTLEHIPKSLSPSGKIDTAPKDFTVTGLETEGDQNGMSLGNYTYTDDDRPLQYYPVQVSPEKLKPFTLYELKILNNHGSVHLTCLYRFRIHGKPFQSA